MSGCTRRHSRAGRRPARSHPRRPAAGRSEGSECAARRSRRPRPAQSSRAHRHRRGRARRRLLARGPVSARSRAGWRRRAGRRPICAPRRAHPPRRWSKRRRRAIGARRTPNSRRRVTPSRGPWPRSCRVPGSRSLACMISYRRGRVTQHILLLRGINLGARNRIAMPALRDTLTEAGFADVRTYLQSGNIVLTSGGKGDDIAGRVHALIEQELGLDIAVVTRTRAELAKIVERNPLAKVARDAKRYQVSFLDAKPSRDVVRRIEETADAKERVVVDGREIYAWHPDTIARSKLWALLAGQKLGVTATARNWRTVQKLLELADAPAPS